MPARDNRPIESRTLIAAPMVTEPTKPAVQLRLLPTAKPPVDRFGLEFFSGNGIVSSQPWDSRSRKRL
jgi:hypothetical protein